MHVHPSIVLVRIRAQKSKASQPGVAATKEKEILEPQVAEAAKVNSRVRFSVPARPSIHPLRRLREAGTCGLVRNPMCAGLETRRAVTPGAGHGSESF
jgi:hypothetical protein